MHSQFYQEHYSIPPLPFTNYHTLSSYSNEELLLKCIESQFQLTKNLMGSQDLLRKYLQEKERFGEETPGESGNEISGCKKSSGNEEDEKQQEKKEEKEEKEVKKRERKDYIILESKLREKKRFKYEFEEEDDENGNFKKPCETKNMVKNYSKSIINFIRRNTHFRQKILRKFHILDEHFLTALEQIKQTIYSIAQLRALWTTHQYGRVFRVFSEAYLRKHSLEHIFNSRVANYQIHCKYREKMLRSLKKPEQFTSIKDF